jgi:hypothetical protein
MEVRSTVNMNGPHVVDHEAQHAVFVDTAFTAEVGGLTVTGRLAADPSTGTIGLDALSIDSPDPIAPADLRRIPWSRVLDEVLNFATCPVETHGGRITYFPGAGTEVPGSTVRRPKMGRRRALDDGHYKDVASVYRAAHKRGQPATRAVAEHFGVSPRTAEGYVAKARELGHLGPAPAKGAKGEQR